MATTELYPQTQWESLFRQLISSLQTDPLAPCTSTTSEGTSREVVFEVCSKGFVYVLTRTRSAPSNERITLSPREKEIIRLVCDGLPNKSISDVLEISPWTVATYLKRIFAKLAVCSRAEMVARVLQDGLLDHSNQPLN